MIEMMRIEPLPGKQDNIVAAVVSGTVTTADYHDILIPAIEAKLSHYRKIRLLYQIGPAFRTFTAGAVWDDAKVGLWHIKEFERVALVSDLEWVKGAMKVLGFIMPCPVKVFLNAELPEAKAWIAGE